MYFEKDEFDTNGKKNVDLTEEDICPVDLYVKSKIVTDCIQFIRKKPENRA